MVASHGDFPPGLLQALEARLTQMQNNSETPAPRSKFGAGIRTWFLTGLIIAGPLAVTASLVWWFVTTVVVSVAFTISDYV